jgi:hypothetical protein
MVRFLAKEDGFTAQELNKKMNYWSRYTQYSLIDIKNDQYITFLYAITLRDVNDQFV